MFQFIFFLIVAGIIALWVTAAVKLNAFGKRGISHFFIMLLATIAICALLFVIIVVPVMDCKGFLCGLDMVFLFMACGLIILIAMPIILLTASTNYFRKRVPVKVKNEQVLEDLD